MRRPLVGAIAGAVTLGGVVGYMFASREPSAVGGRPADSLHTSSVGGSVGTYSGDSPMKYPQSLAAITTTSAAALALSAAFIGESANAQQAVQWRVEDGGSGHWYGIRAGAGSWNSHNTAATAIGGQLACVNSTTEHEWIASHLLAPNPSLFYAQGWGPHIGGVQAVGAVEPLGGWSWIDGQPLLCAPTLCAMENCCGNQDRLTYARILNPTRFEFNDTTFKQAKQTLRPARSSNGPPIATPTASLTTARSWPANSTTRTPTISPTAASRDHPAPALPTSS